MKRRFFKTDNPAYQEYYILEIDEDFVTFKKFLFGHLINKKEHGISDLEDKIPNYTDLSFDELSRLNPYENGSGSIPDAVLKLAKSRGIDMNERMKNGWTSFFEDIRSVMIACEEVSENCIYSDVLKIVVKDDYNESVMIVPFLNGIVTIAFEGIELTEAEAKYEQLREQYPLLKTQLYSALHGKFEEFKDEVERPMETRLDRRMDAECFPELKGVNDIERIINPKFLTIGDFGYMIRFDCSWEQEHGIEVILNNSFEFNIN